MPAYQGPTDTNFVPNAEDIRRHFEFWFHDALAGLIEVGNINPSTGALTQFKRFEIGDDGIVEWVARINQIPGANVYFRPALIKPDVSGRYVTDADFLATPGPWADLDDEGSFTRLESLNNCKPSAEIITGEHPHKRGQLFWRCDELISDPDTLKTLNINLQHFFNSDPAVTNLTTLMRIGGSIAWPYKPNRIPELTTFNAYPEIHPLPVLQRAFTQSAMERLLATAQKITPSTTTPTTTPKSNGIIATNGQHHTAQIYGIHSPLTGRVNLRLAIENMKQGKLWHNSMIAVVAHMVAMGHPDEDIFALAPDVTTNGYSINDTIREFSKAIQGARHKFTRQPTDPQQQYPPPIPEIPVRTHNFQWWRDGEPVLTTNDFVQGVLGLGELSLLYGEPGCGKSFFAMDLGYHVAAGRLWRGKRVDQGGVLYYSLEGSYGSRNRMAALRAHYKSDADRDLPFVLASDTLNLLDSLTDTEWLIDGIKTAAAECGMPIKLVIIDTLSRAMAGGNENASEIMGAIILAADHVRRQTGVHILFIHHCGKNQALGARGHSSLRAAVDTEIEITRPEHDPTATAKIEKQRELPDVGIEFKFQLKQIELGINRRAEPVTSCVVEPIGTLGQAIHPQDQDLLHQRGGPQHFVYKQIVNLYAAGKAYPEQPEPDMTTTMCIQRDHLRTALIESGYALADEQGKIRHQDAVKLHKHLNQLRDQGAIHFNNRLIWRLK